ncbi:MAG: tetratricopeptide repeat protein [Vicinamibacterales bacterium]
MDGARWERIQSLFHDAAALPLPDQRGFLERACGDEGLVADVLAMLEHDAAGASLLDRDVAHVAHDVLSEAVPSLPAGKFGPYRLTKLLGEGGMGVVYLAERNDLGSVAAIKILRDAWLSPARRERFISEQRLLAQLSHASIARLFDADTLPDGTPWFAMEYVEGVPLTDYCRRRPTSISERLRLFREVCGAVQHAHQHLVVHRDLKPSNILVTRDGSIKLLDFGISKQLESLDGTVDLTRTGLRLMTPAYAAPEQIRGAQTGIHTDVYALGMLLYELLTGRLPFDLSNRTPAEAASIVVEGETEKPSAAAGRQGASRASWADLDVLCSTAMHKDPARRYRTVDALLRDVDHYLGGAPLEARRDSVGYRTAKFVGRNWRPLATAALVLVAVLGLVGFYTFQLARARNAAVAETARTQRIQRFMLNLFEGGDEAAGPAESLRVVTLIDRGVQEARTLDGEPAVQAELYQTLGGIYQKLGSFDRAESLLRSSLDRRRSLFGPDHPDVAASLLAVGQLRVDQAKLEEGESLIREALDRSRRSLPRDHPSMAEATASLGRVLQERGKYDEAIKVLDEAVKVYSTTGPATPGHAAALYELANTHFYAGHYEISDSLNHRLLDIYSRLHGERHPHVAQVLVNLGANQFEWGRYKEAERFYRQAIDITQSWYGKDHHLVAAHLTMLGRTLIRDERHEEAVDLLEQALAIRERVYGKAHPQVASTLNELGTIALLRGRLDDAERHFVRMADTYRGVYGATHYLLGIARSNLASVFVARKQYPEAERLYREVITRFAETQGPEHLNTGIARVKLGRALVRQGRFAEAEGEILAGYDILTKQTSPTVSWLKAAREDLVEVYDALRQPDRAARYRQELAGPDAQ